MKRLPGQRLDVERVLIDSRQSAIPVPERVLFPFLFNKRHGSHHVISPWLEQEIKSSVSVQRIIGKQIRGNISPDLQRHERDVKGGLCHSLCVALWSRGELSENCCRGGQ